MQWTWPIELTDALQKVPEWYVPGNAAEIILRGIQHGNCVGSYVERHFAASDKELNPKCLLLFTDFYEAELRIFFGPNDEGKIVSVNAGIYQAKGRYNKDAPKEQIQSLFNAKKFLLGLTAGAFVAVRVSVNENTE